MRIRFTCALLFAVVLCRPAAASTDHWVKVTSAHFTVVSDAGAKEAKHILDQFEHMRWVFHTLFSKANVDPVQPIVVVAAKNADVFDTMESSAYLGPGKLKPGGYFQSSSDKYYILLRLDAKFEHPYAAVYHEYTHLEFAADSAWMPLWLNEGLAEFMQNTDIHNKYVDLGEPNVNDILYLRRHPMMPLSVLFKVDVNSPYYHEEKKGSVFYAESWVLTHYLMVNDRERKLRRLARYMDLVKGGMDSLTAAKETFGDLKKLQQTLKVYIQTGSYKEFVLSSKAAPIDEAAFKVTALTQVEADAVRADVQARVGRAADARTLAETVLKEDPNDVQALETMGFIAFKAKNYEEARKWYGEAVKANSQDYLAQYYFASLSIGVSGPGKDEAIESSLRAAIRLNPHFAPAYNQLAAFYAMHHQHLEEAHMLSAQAIELDPGKVAYRINAAHILMTMGQNANAMIVLRTAEKVAKNPREAAMVQNQIEQLQQLEAERAQAESYAQQQAQVPAASKVIVVGAAPKHPTEPTTGHKSTVVGVIHHISCYYPSGFEFDVVTASGKAVRLYNNDFIKIDLTTVGFILKASMNPCVGFDGMRVLARYVASPDKTVAGQVVSMVLRK